MSNFSIEKLSEKTNELHNVIIEMDSEGAYRVAREILDMGGDAVQVIDTVIKPAADEIGDKFQREEYYLPQLILAGSALESAMGVLLGELPENWGGGKDTIIIGTVKGDIHTIGKNIVAMMFKTGGFTVYDIGVDVESERFVKEALDKKADIIALSSLLTTTMPYQREVIELLKEKGLRERFKVMVGGGPVTESWAKEIGADGYSKDANEALRIARKLMGGKL